MRPVTAKRRKCSTKALFYAEISAARLVVSPSGSPDERRHPAALSIPPMRIEPRSDPRKCTLAAAHVADTQRIQSPARQPGQIRLPAAARIGRKQRRGALIRIHERVAHVIAHFEMLARDRRALTTRQSPGATPIARTVFSSTPLASPRQPACAAPTVRPSRLAKARADNPRP